MKLLPISLLLVEDSPADIFLVKEAMRSEGLTFQMEVAEDGESAIRFLDRIDANREMAPPSLILLDINIPRRSGTEVLERLRQTDRCRRVPVVVISSSDSPADRQGALELGACEYFRKPSTLDEFMQLGQLIRRLHERKARAAAQ